MQFSLYQCTVYKCNSLTSLRVCYDTRLALLIGLYRLGAQHTRLLHDPKRKCVCSIYLQADIETKHSFLYRSSS